jgi:hypothetical protein
MCRFTGHNWHYDMETDSDICWTCEEVISYDAESKEGTAEEGSKGS